MPRIRIVNPQVKTDRQTLPEPKAECCVCTEAADAKTVHENSMIFPIGKPNDGFAQYFIGQSFIAPVSMEQVGIFNVTFEPGCRNNWHIHHADKGGGQILVCVAGRGYYQEWGKEAVEMR